MLSISSKRVVVLGQGYVGLPVSMRAVEVGFDVVGYEVDEYRVELLERGVSFIEDVSNDQLAEALQSRRFHPTADSNALEGFGIAVVSVPTPLRNWSPDLSYIEKAAAALAKHIKPGCCVVLESTTYPGTTEGVFIPLLEAGSGLVAGRDFYVGYSPERIDPGNGRWRFQNTPKLVSGIDDASLAVVTRFYGQLVDEVVPVSGVREAELAKLLENTFRHVNVALVNELAIYCHELEIDVWSVIDAAASKPFGFMRFTPGPGVGGHCLPIDPTYLSWQVRQSLGKTFRFVEIANDINEQMPHYIVRRVADRLNWACRSVNNSNILLVGLAYKANSGDARHSPAITVANLLAGLGARLTAVDSLIAANQVPLCVELVKGTEEDVIRADLVIVLADHDTVDWPLLERYADRVLDTRNRVVGATRL